MQNKLNFLLDRSLNFDIQHAEMLDSLTQDLKSNSASVTPALPRAKRPMRSGAFSSRTTTSGTTRRECSNCAGWTRPRSSFWCCWRTRSR